MKNENCATNIQRFTVESIERLKEGNEGAITIGSKRRKMRKNDGLLDCPLCRLRIDQEIYPCMQQH